MLLSTEANAKLYIAHEAHGGLSSCISSARYNIAPIFKNETQNILKRISKSEHIKIFGTVGRNIVVQYIPGRLHGQAMVCITDALAQALRIPDPTGEYVYEKPIMRTGSNIVKMGHPNKESEEGDCGFQPWFEEYEEPSVVIEGGVSETADELRTGMVWWFACDEIKLVILMIVDDASAEGDRPGKLIVEEYESIESIDLWSQHRRQRTMIQRHEWFPDTPPPLLSLPLFPFFDTIPVAFGGRSEIQLPSHILTCGWGDIQDAWARTLKERRTRQGVA